METWASVLHRSTFYDRQEKLKILEGRLRKFLFLPKLPCRISGKFLFRTRSLARIHHRQVRSRCPQGQAKHFDILLPVCSRYISTNKTENHLACHPELHMLVISKQEDAYITGRRGWETLCQAFSVSRTITWFSPWVLSNYYRGRTYLGVAHSNCPVGDTLVPDGVLPEHTGSELHVGLTGEG